ncbi:MAG: hypothetical protein ACRBFS_07930 [Aureispira sp.]
MSVNKRLKAYLDHKEKNVSQIARELGVPNTTLNNVISGRSKPGWKVCKPLAEDGVNLHWLILGEGPMMRQDYEGKIINQGNLTNQFGGNNNTGISNELNTSSKNVAHLEKRIATLESQLADKDKIISLLEGK